MPQLRRNSTPKKYVVTDRAIKSESIRQPYKRIAATWAAILHFLPSRIVEVSRESITFMTKVVGSTTG